MNVTTPALTDFTSLETMIVTIFISGAVVLPPILLFGFVANVTNIIVYLKIGTKDSLSISFFMLSCADLVCVMLMGVSFTSILLAETFRDKWRVDGEDLCWLTLYYYSTFYDISQGSTTFIADQKCWCVALPFRFKDTFTTTLTTSILTGIFLAIFTYRMPILAKQDMVEMFDPMRNRTLFTLWTSDVRVTVYPVVGLISLVYTTACQVTVVFCLIILASGLRASSKFRNSTLIPNTEPHSSELKDKKVKTDEKFRSNAKVDKKISSKRKMVVVNGTSATNRLSDINYVDIAKISTNIRPVLNTTSRRELQAIKSATFVSVLFVLFNTFKLLECYFLACIPEYGPFGRFINTYVVANVFRLTIEAVDLSFNVIVYVKLNSRFRSTLYSGFRYLHSKLST